jgi:hypothetical protein
MSNHTINLVYGLVDPRTSELRYVGITCRLPRVRFLQHLSMARNGDHTYRSRWIRELLALDLNPEMIIIEETTDRSRECYWIERYRTDGARLTNLTDGGDGTMGYRFTPEQRGRMSIAQRARPHVPCSEDRLQSLRISNERNRGKRHSEEWNRHISEKTKGRRPNTDECQERATRAARLWSDPAYHAKQVEAHCGHTLTAEHRERVRQGVVKSWAKRHAAAARSVAPLLGQPDASAEG